MEKVWKIWTMAKQLGHGPSGSQKGSHTRCTLSAARAGCCHLCPLPLAGVGVVVVACCGGVVAMAVLVEAVVLVVVVVPWGVCWLCVPALCP